MARVFAVASAKGGVGKTTTTANVGAMLAGTGADVVVIDGDIGMANLGAALGIDAPADTLHDVLSGTATPTAATYEGPGGVYIVPGATALSAYAEADPSKLQSVINVHSQADYVLIDVGAGVSHESSLPLSIADEVLLVSTPERDALQDTEKTRQLTNQLGGTVAGAVITRVTESTPVSEMVTGTLGTEILATVPEDAAVPDALAVGEPLTDYAPRSPAAEGYRDLVAALTDREPERPPEPASTADAGTATTAAGDTPAAETGSAVATEETETASGSETGEVESATADTAAGAGGNEGSDATTGQRPGEDIESKWEEAATGDHVDDESGESAQTADSIAEATEAVEDSAAAPASADDVAAADESDDDAGVAATTVDEGESGDVEGESAPAADTTPEEEAASDTASETVDTAAGEPADTPDSGDETTTGETTDAGEPGSAVTPEPADATATDDSDDTVEDGVSIPESEMNSEEESGASGEATSMDAEDSPESSDDAVPFRDEDEGSDEVVDPVEPQPGDQAEGETQTDDAPTDEDPVIPDAESDDSGSAVPTELMGGPDEESGDTDEDDESGGFLRRLLFG